MTEQPSADAATESKTERVVQYLRTEAKASGGVTYVKGKHIAADVDLSPQEIGAILSDLKDTALDIEVEKWAYTTATTWRICAT